MDSLAEKAQGRLVTNVRIILHQFKKMTKKEKKIIKQVVTDLDYIENVYDYDPHANDDDGLGLGVCQTIAGIAIKELTELLEK